MEAVNVRSVKKDTKGSSNTLLGLVSCFTERMLETKHHTATALFGTLTQRSVHPTVPVLVTGRNKK
jgi:hypothetical protein